MWKKTMEVVNTAVSTETPSNDELALHIGVYHEYQVGNLHSTKISFL